MIWCQVPVVVLHFVYDCRVGVLWWWSGPNTDLFSPSHCLVGLVARCLPWDRLVGLVVKASASRAEDPGFESCLRRDFSGLSHTSDLKIGTPVATLPGVIGSALGLVGLVSVYCDWVRWKVWSATSICVIARKIVWADLSLRYTRMLLGC